jgi:predicted anti-sigma-YlaC factor YlaD
MHGCSDVMKLLYAFLDGKLDAKGMVRVKTHLQECTCCRDAFTSEQTFLELLKSHTPGIPQRTKVCN